MSLSGAAVWRRVSDLFELEAPLKDGADPFTKIEPDPWGSQYYIEVDGEKFRVVSPGPDGVAGTEDDIAYPPCE